MRPDLSDNMQLLQWSVVDLEVLLRGKGNYCFNQENFKNGYGLYYLWRNKWGFRLQAPPLDPPLISLIEVANVDSTV